MLKGLKKLLTPLIFGEEKSQDAKNKINVYFVSGMGCSCACFDDLILPDGFEKVYIEWLMPKEEELLLDYSKRMANVIDQSKPFVLVGYSLGGYIVQTMTEFLLPRQVIIISSIKNEKEISKLFKLARKINFADIVPDKLYNSSDFIINLFNKYLYATPVKTVASFLNITDPNYIKWALKKVYQCIPNKNIDNLVHIHGTRDQIFPFELIDECISIRGGDHLMLVKRSIQVNKILNNILTKTY